MTKRIMTSYQKLNNELKKAIFKTYPEGVEDRLTEMKHIIKGHQFKGLVFEHEDTTYLIDWSVKNNFTFLSDEIEDEIAASYEGGEEEDEEEEEY